MVLDHQSPSEVYRQNSKPVSVLSCHLSTQPTPWQRAGSPFISAEASMLPVYMVLLVLVPSPPYVAIQRRELLPRGFTLTLAGGLFSVTAFIRLLPSVLSTAGCPTQSGLSSEADFSDKSFYLYVNELFISELTLDTVIFSVKTLDLLAESRRDVLAMLVALHGS